MQEHERDLTGAERELEEALSSLTPVASITDTGEMLYRAGLEAGRRGARRSYYLSGALAAGLALSLFLRPGPQVQERVVLVHEQPAQKLRQTPAPDTRLVMHEFPLERTDWWSRFNRFWTALPEVTRKDSYFGIEARPASTAKAHATAPQPGSALIRQMLLRRDFERTLGIDSADLGGTYRIQSQTSSGESAL